MRRPGFLQRRDRDDRGAVAVLVGLLMTFVLIAIAAFTLDLGMQRVVRRDMQALADVVALDLARLLDGRRRNDITNGSDGRPPLEEALQASVARNDSTTLGEGRNCDDKRDVGYTKSLAWTSTGPSCVYVYLVRMDEPDGPQDPPYPTVAHGSEVRPQNVGNDPETPDGVVVYAHSAVDFAFGLADSGGATRSAVSSTPEPTRCFELGSFAAALSLGDSVLAPMADWLGLSTELDLVSYEHLLGADVSLRQMVGATPSVGSPDALLDPSGIAVGTLLNATIDALQNEDEAASNTAAISVLQGLLNVDAGLDLAATVVLPEVVRVDAGDEAALGSQLNVLELIGSSLALANQDNFVDTDVSIDLTGVGLGVGSLSISAVQGARMACGKPDEHPEDSCEDINDRGGACATQSQVEFALTLAETTVPLIDVGDVDGLDATTLDVSATVGPVLLTGGVGRAKGVLTSIDSCGPPDQATVNVGAGLLGVGLTVPLSVDGSLVIDVGSVLPDELESLVGNVLNLPGLLGGILGGYRYEYRAHQLSLDIEETGVNLYAASEGTTSTEDAALESPTNDRATGEPVRVPDPPQAPTLDDLSLPADFLTGKVTARLTYEWRRQPTTLLGVPTGEWSAWTSNTSEPPPGADSGPLFSGDLAGLSAQPAPLGTVGAVLEGKLANVTTALNDRVVGTVNDTFDGTLLPLLGLSGTGADLYSVPRSSAATCGGTPMLVG